jgi:1-deoxy-D-xylulose-5-phosphate reductoisomerase
MGKKITVDSASMMNKALEVIEARWLFDLSPHQIDVLIHPQSIVHSMVEFVDGAILSQMGVPDMRVPILYALSFPDRLQTGAAPLDLSQMGALTFEEVDAEKFPGLSLAYQALQAGGTACAALNAANEVAVQAFLAERIPFGHIWRISKEALERLSHGPADSLQAVRDADQKARRMAERLIT